MYFLGTFETGSTTQFTSATGSAQSTTKKEDSYGGVSLNGTSFVKNINTDYGDSAKTKVWIGAWFRWTSDPSGNWYLIKADGEVYRQFSLGINSQQLYIEVADNSAVAGTATLVANTWYFIQVESYVHASAGYAKVYVDGVLDIDTGLVDSLRGTDTGIRRAEWIGSEHASISCYLDNCLFCDYDPNFGIKVTKAGKDASSMDPKNQDFNSGNFFLKFHDQQDTSVTFNPGDTEQYIDISHSLGYVPAFKAFFDYEGNTYMIPSIPVSTGFDQWAYAHATSTNIRVGFKMFIPYNQVEFTGSNSDINEELWTGSEGLIVGNVSGSGKSSAVRFSSVTLANSESLVSANLEVLHCFSGPTNSDTKYKIYGIDEDDVGSGFDWTYSKTSAFDARNQSKSSGFWNFGTDVLDQVNEIITRGGWASGNHMGFIFEEDASPSDAYIGDDSSSTIKLTIVKSGTLTIPFRIIIFKDKIAT